MLFCYYISQHALDDEKPVKCCYAMESAQLALACCERHTGAITILIHQLLAVSIHSFTAEAQTAMPEAL